MSDKKKILIIGSMNVDMVVKASRIPKIGETVLGGVFSQFMGGKGANQAMAALKLFPETSFCAGVGNDGIGREYVKYLKEGGLNVKLVKIFENEHTGVALITIAKEGQNIITVAPGANLKLSKEDIGKIDFSKYSHVAFQLENEISTVRAGLVSAKKAGCTTVLTPAPAQLLDAEILKNTDFIVPNEIEILQVQRGYASISAAAEGLLKKGVGNVLVTLGERGCELFNADSSTRYAAHSVRPIDTVGAGDCFTGSFVAGLKIYGSVEQAIKIANAAAAIKVTKRGAQNFGTLAEVQKMMAKK